nr:helix-turn-helix transcriptional regulator [uncultured Selenomonas sp.]
MKTRLKEIREASGKTQLQIAEETGVTVRAYQRYEHGEQRPNVRTAIRIADALGVKDVRSLWGGNPVRT